MLLVDHLFFFCTCMNIPSFLQVIKAVSNVRGNTSTRILQALHKHMGLHREITTARPKPEVHPFAKREGECV